jgi:hypothetical protein
MPAVPWRRSGPPVVVKFITRSAGRTGPDQPGAPEHLVCQRGPPGPPLVGSLEAPSITSHFVSIRAS